jgi:hypothetical protein
MIERYKPYSQNCIAFACNIDESLSSEETTPRKNGLQLIFSQTCDRARFPDQSTHLVELEFKEWN